MATKRIKTVAYLKVKDRRALNKLAAETGTTLSKLIEQAVRQIIPLVIRIRFIEPEVRDAN